MKPSAEGATPEVVFANTHDLSVPEPKDAPDDDHDLALFLKLNPALGDAILVSKKPPGSAGHIFTGNTVVDRLRDIKYSGGDPPDCCDN